MSVIKYKLTSSFVVWSEPTRYVWKPARPITDHTEKKHTIASITVSRVKENNNHAKEIKQNVSKIKIKA